MNIELSTKLICQNVKRIVELVPNIESTINTIDLETSTGMIDSENIIATAEIARSILLQMDSDLLTLITMMNYIL